jgi:hypothetical protein
MVNTLSGGSDSDGAVCVVFGFRQSFGKTGNDEMRGFFPFTAFRVRMTINFSEAFR